MKTNRELVADLLLAHREQIGFLDAVAEVEDRLGEYTVEQMVERLIAYDPYVEVERAGTEGWRVRYGSGIALNRTLRGALEAACQEIPPT